MKILNMTTGVAITMLVLSCGIFIHDANAQSLLEELKGYEAKESTEFYVLETLMRQQAYRVLEQTIVQYNEARKVHRIDHVENTFNKDGAMVGQKVTSYDGAGNFVQAAIVTVDRPYVVKGKVLKETRGYYDTKGKLTGTAKFEGKYDKEGRLLEAKITKYDLSGNITDVTVISDRKYDKDGVLLSQVVTHRTGDGEVVGRKVIQNLGKDKMTDQSEYRISSYDGDTLLEIDDISTDASYFDMADQGFSSQTKLQAPKSETVKRYTVDKGEKIFVDAKRIENKKIDEYGRSLETTIITYSRPEMDMASFVSAQKIKYNYSSDEADIQFSLGGHDETKTRALEETRGYYNFNYSGRLELDYVIHFEAKFDDKGRPAKERLTTYDPKSGEVLEFKLIDGKKYDKDGYLVSEVVTTRTKEGGEFVDRKVIESLGIDKRTKQNIYRVTTYGDEENKLLIETDVVFLSESLFDAVDDGFASKTMGLRQGAKEVIDSDLEGLLSVKTQAAAVREEVEAAGAKIDPNLASKSENSDLIKKE